LRARSLAAAQDVGEIAVLQDEGDLFFPRNLVDLQSAGLQFTPTAEGYRVARVDRPVSGDAGERLPLEDDDSREVTLPFSFRFFGQEHTSVFVNSDGNLTFGESDNASTPRSLGRMLVGPPRIAPLFADFDPTAGGTVTTSSQGDRLTIRWTSVPQWGETDANTFEVTLRADGTLEFAYAAELNDQISEAHAGIAPGRQQGGLTAVDLSEVSGAESSGALAESFRTQQELDTLAVAQKFYRTHGDDYMQLVVFTNRRALSGNTFAFEQTVNNTTAGIGFRPFDASASYGSAGRLESFVLMGTIRKYPDAFDFPFLGTDSALAVLAHETGHRWLALATFRDGTQISRELLGRAEVHWSFFMDTDASHLEGNDLEDLGDGSFRTGESGQRYSALDQYLMGVRPPEEVAPFFFVREPSGVLDTDPGRDPQPDVSFRGTRKDVRIEDLVAAMGPRQPPAGVAPTTLRQAFIFVSIGEPADPALIDKVDRFRQAWEPHFVRATEGRATIETRLN
jgi:hypothetical protein